MWQAGAVVTRCSLHVACAPRQSRGMLGTSLREVRLVPSEPRLAKHSWVRMPVFQAGESGSIPERVTGCELVWSFSARLKSERTSFDSTAADRSEGDW
jgi:hypothetical protein